jgi:hypothetical protein
MILCDGFTAQTREVDVGPSAALDVEVRLVPTVRYAPVPPSPLPPPTAAVSPALTAPAPYRPVAVPPVDSGGWRGNAQRTAGYTLGGLGIAVATLGGVLAAVSAHEGTDALDRLRAARTGTEWDGVKPDLDQAKSRNTAGWAAIAVGGAVLATGAVLIATAPSSHSRSGGTVAPWKSKDGGRAKAWTAW